VSIGGALAEARSRAGLTITQVSQRTCIRETIIRGIERDDFSACGGDFYARGHIRSIARTVGTDPEDLIREYDAAHGAPHEIRAADVFEPATPIKLRERRSPNWSVAMVVVLAVVIGYGVFRLVVPSSSHVATSARIKPTASHSASAPASATPSPSVSASASPTPSAPPASGVSIQVTAVADCWVGFTRPDGSYLKQSYVLSGTTKTWTFPSAVHMEIGNPGGILLTVNGRKLGKPGQAGQPLTLTLGPGKKLPAHA
jgi:cytoskeletal protein RodZ